MWAATCSNAVGQGSLLSSIVMLKRRSVRSQKAAGDSESYSYSEGLSDEALGQQQNTQQQILQMWLWVNRNQPTIKGYFFL